MSDLAQANPFVLPRESYQRDLNILQVYLKDSATYLHQMTGKPYDVCFEWVVKQIKPGGKFPFKDPRVKFLERQDNGDREIQETTLSKYINSAIKEKSLISPTFTIYYHPSRKKSLLVDFIDGNVALRSKAKKAMFAARQAKDHNMATIKESEQTNRKLKNNALSGAHVSTSTPLNNKTAHSTLTSNCRSTSGYGNANNEKFLCGNRHYWGPDIVRFNIISIINHSDYAAIEAAMTQYGLRYPTVEETIQCIRYSTDLYWTAGKQGRRQFAQIERLVHSLNPLQRAAFMFTGDLYHLMKVNPDMVYQFITELSARIEVPHPDPVGILKTIPEDNQVLAMEICADDLRGKELKKITDTREYAIYASTAENVCKVLAKYFNFIRTFFVTPNVPASVAYFPESIRRAAVTSDTDSTIFTVQDWVMWYKGKLSFDAEATAVAAVTVFLASQSITHVLARMSANFGIEEKRLFQIAMKNEYKFDIFTPTQVAKHYFALISRQEAELKSEYEKEIKGVHLKSSNAPKVIMKQAQTMMTRIMENVIKGELLSAVAFLTEIADIERAVIESIKRGGHDYFRKGQIKPADSYVKKEEATGFHQFTLWRDVFAPKYGMCEDPPYMCVKISVELETPMKTKTWLAGLYDKDLVARIEAWMAANNKKHLGSTFMLPEAIISSIGIPEEVLSVVGVRKIVLDTTKVFYLICESLGIYMLNKKLTRLCSDYY